MKKLFSVFMVMALSFALAIPSFAVSYPSLDNVDWDKDAYPYAYVANHGVICLILSQDRPRVSGERINTNEPYIQYNYDANSNSWVYQGRFMNGISMPVGKIEMTSHDIMDGDNVHLSADTTGFFFPIHLEKLVLELTEKELVEVAIPEMVGAMKVLVPCGVGLMALLVGLSLFGKRSLLFLR